MIDLPNATDNEATRIGLAGAGPIASAVLYNNGKALGDALTAAGVSLGGAGDTLPVGTIVWYGGTTAPTGYLKADGSSQLRSVYSSLFTVIGTSYGAGSVPGTTFALPNFVGTTGIYVIKYTSSAVAVTTSSFIGVPVGTLQLYASPAYPTGWLRADGSAISRTTYADLYAVIGTTYGAGDGSTTFNIPNLVSSGTGSPVYIIKAVVSGDQQPATVAHASSHIRGGTDVIDADRDQIDFVPAYYTRDSSPVEAGAVTDLTAHLKGIDNGLFNLIKIKQVLSTSYGTEVSTTGSTLVDTNLNLSITPTSSSSKILVIATTPIRVDNSPNTGYYEAAGVITLRRGSSNLQSQGFGSNLYEAGSKTFFGLSSFVYLDAPGTTSSINYKTMIKSSSTSFRMYSNATAVYGGVNLDTTVSQIVLIEIL